jgi:putative N6-adenine-specific DNA methylase
MEHTFCCFASAAFGIEGLVSAELKRLGASGVSTKNGGVQFNANTAELYEFNLRMHFSDRLFIILSDTVCTSFEDLYQAVFKIDWPFYFSEKEAINVTCKCTKSTLMSVRDCQAITKKAIIEKLKKSTGQQIFPESGPALAIHVSIRNNQTRIMLNTSGDALSRRGYRTWNGEAPLRETLAAALVELSPWRPGVPLHDPCCGTGTLLIEAALFASHRSPGLYRHFAMEDLRFSDKDKLLEVRQNALSEVVPEQISGISGSDIDSDALKLARRHIVQAGLNDNSILLSCVPLQKLHLDFSNGVFLCNPPYGERLSDQNSCRRLYHNLHELKDRHQGWRLCAISSDPAFERSYGKKADRKRRLYNGRLECVFYCYD